MIEIKRFYIFFVLLAMVLNSCYNKPILSNEYFSMKLLPEWKLINKEPIKYILQRDTAFLEITIRNETKLYNILLRAPEEYITTEDGNLLSGFAFLDSNTTYTNKNDIVFIKQSIAKDSTKKNYTVKENESTVVRRFIKVVDISKKFDDIDYLCEFLHKNEVKWLPVKIPKYFDDFIFNIDSTKNHYRKLYFPKRNKQGKAGFIYHSYKSHYTLTAQSSLLSGSSPLMEDIKKMISSIEILQK